MELLVALVLGPHEPVVDLPQRYRIEYRFCRGEVAPLDDRDPLRFTMEGSRRRKELDAVGVVFAVSRHDEGHGGCSRAQRLELGARSRRILVNHDVVVGPVALDRLPCKHRPVMRVAAQDDEARAVRLFSASGRRLERRALVSCHGACLPQRRDDVGAQDYDRPTETDN